MFDFKDKIISSSISKFKVFLDVEKSNYDVSGILLNEYYGFLIKFRGIREMLNSLDKLFNYVNFPMTSHNERMFLKNNENVKKELPKNLFEYDENNEYISKKQPVFILHVQFRYNSTWQGTVTWIEKNITKNFVSDLQLINLIIDAVELGK